MKINISENDNIKYVDIIGNLDGVSSIEALDIIMPVIEENETKIIIDMAQCHYVSSAGLRTLLTIGKKIKMNNGAMNIINLIDEVKDIMEMTGFSSIFESFK